MVLWLFLFCVFHMRRRATGTKLARRESTSQRGVARRGTTSSTCAKHARTYVRTNVRTHTLTPKQTIAISHTIIFLGCHSASYNAACFLPWHCTVLNSILQTVLFFFSNRGLF